MSNMNVTNNDIGSVVLCGAKFSDDGQLLTAAGAATFKEGTILARDSSTLKYVPYVKGGSTNGNGVPKGILTYPVVAAGAGDLPVRVAVAGEFRLERLVINADGDDSNIDNAVKDQLRDYGLVPVSVQELNTLDNQ